MSVDICLWIFESRRKKGLCQLRLCFSFCLLQIFSLALQFCKSIKCHFTLFNWNGSTVVTLCPAQLWGQHNIVLHSSLQGAKVMVVILQCLSVDFFLQLMVLYRPYNIYMFCTLENNYWAKGGKNVSLFFCHWVVLSIVKQDKSVWLTGCCANIPHLYLPTFKYRPWRQTLTHPEAIGHLCWDMPGSYPPQSSGKVDARAAVMLETDKQFT